MWQPHVWNTYLSDSRTINQKMWKLPRVWNSYLPDSCTINQKMWQLPRVWNSYLSDSCTINLAPLVSKRSQKLFWTVKQKWRFEWCVLSAQAKLPVTHCQSEHGNINNHNHPNESAIAIIIVDFLHYRHNYYQTATSFYSNLHIIICNIIIPSSLLQSTIIIIKHHEA